MSKKDPRDALKELLQRSDDTAALGSGSPRYRKIGTGTATEDLGKRLWEDAAELESAPLTGWFVFDTTRSMGTYIKKVHDVITVVGAEVLACHENIRAAVLGVGDHCDYPTLQQAGVALLGDY